MGISCCSLQSLMAGLAWIKGEERVRPMNSGGRILVVGKITSAVMLARVSLLRTR